MAERVPPTAGGVQSVHRALSLLEAVGFSGELGVTELASRLSLAVSTVHNIVRTMVQRGYLVNAGGRYRLGPAVTVIGAQWDPALSLPALLVPRLAELSKNVELSSFASVMVGREAQVVATQLAPGSIAHAPPDLRRGNPLDQSTGRVLVALTRQDAWSEFAAAGTVLEPGWTPQHWMDEFARIADSGCAVKIDGERHATIGVPVWASNATVFCSISAGIPAFQVSPERVQRTIDGLWDCAIALSGDLGAEEIPLRRPTLSSSAVRRWVS